VVVKAHCEGGARHLGKIFRVEQFHTGSATCSSCGESLGITTAAGYKTIWHHAAYLKRIPPLGELEGQPTEELLYEPA
jgi:hypothetical protein